VLLPYLKKATHLSASRKL